MSNESKDIRVRDRAAVDEEGTRPGAVFRPEVDIVERPDAYVIFADVPGASEDSVEVVRGSASADSSLSQSLSSTRMLLRKSSEARRNWARPRPRLRATSGSFFGPSTIRATARMMSSSERPISNMESAG